jgi:hypothetical protein
MSEQDDLPSFIHALLQWIRTSIESGRFSKEEASDMRMHAVVLKGMTAAILEQASERDQATERLHRLLAAALYLGSRVMTSESAVKFLKNEHTAPGRSGRAKKREPVLELMRQEIAEAKQKIPSGRGSATAVDHEVTVQMKRKYKRKVSAETVGRHRRRMTTV